MPQQQSGQDSTLQVERLPHVVFLAEQLEYLIQAQRLNWRRFQFTPAARGAVWLCDHTNYLIISHSSQRRKAWQCKIGRTHKNNANGHWAILPLVA